MATRPYCLKLVLHSSGPAAGTTQQTVTIAAEMDEEAVELADFYWGSLPTAARCSAMLTDVAGQVIWSEQDGNAPYQAMRRKDQP